LKLRCTGMAIVVALAAGLAGLAAAQAGQTPEGQRPVFRGGVELVQIDVSVLDRSRRPVTGLTEADFTILEDGIRRPIRGFTAVQLPASTPPATASASRLAAAQPDVTTNRVGQQDGRLVVILMDRTIPPGEPTLAANRIAHAAVDALGPNDLAAVTSTSGGVPQTLTSDRARLRQAIDQRDWSTGPSKEQQDILAGFTGKLDPLSDGRCLCGICVLDTVTQIAGALRQTSRRQRMLLFVGSQLIIQSGPRAPTQDTECEFPLKQARQRMQDALALSHVTVHSIDPSGLSSVGPHTRASTPNTGGAMPRLGRVQQQQAEMSDLLDAQNSLQILPEMTGGRVVVNTNGPQEKVPEIFAESASYYVLAFEPGMAGKPGVNRSIEVKVARKDVRVSAQRKHQQETAVRAAAAAPPTLESALTGLMPDGSLPLSLAVAAFAGTEEPRATVIVNTDVGAFAGPGGASTTLELAVSAVDPTGRKPTIRQDMTVGVTPAPAGGATEANVQALLHLDPGTYEVRVAVRDPATAAAASVFAPLTVPRFADERLSLSDLLVEATPLTPPGSSAAAPGGTTRRMFSSREHVRALVQVYQGTRRDDAVEPVVVHTRVTNVQGGIPRDQQINVAAKDFTNRTAGVASDLGGLPPGDYVFTVDASAGDLKTSRSLRFTVR